MFVRFFNDFRVFFQQYVVVDEIRVISEDYGNVFFVFYVFYSLTKRILNNEILRVETSIS